RSASWYCPIISAVAGLNRARPSMWGIIFFQAEDGIRDMLVTGVQTCALPISSYQVDTNTGTMWMRAEFVNPNRPIRPGIFSRVRSEERRVGKEWRPRRGTSEERKKKKQHREQRRPNTPVCRRNDRRGTA